MMDLKPQVAKKLAAIIETYATKEIPWELLKTCSLHNRTPRVVVPQPTCGKALLYAKQQIIAFREQMGSSVCIFKIGVTAEPGQRFISYLNKNYSSMWVIFSGDDVGVVHMLEAALISEFGHLVGCRNSPNTGGEGALNRKQPPPQPPFYVYIVGGRADQFKCVG